MIKIRKHYNEDLENINSRIFDMGNEVILSFKKALVACKENNIELAYDIKEHDKLINDMEVSINIDGYLLIAKQCPVASDLRKVITALKISSDLERIADYSVNIAKYIIKTKHDNSSQIETISKLGEHIIKMLEGIMEAFKTKNIELALEISALDEILDIKYENEVKNLIKIGKTATDSESEEAMRALLVIKQIERAGDHVTNIAENIVYLVNGKRVELN